MIQPILSTIAQKTVVGHQSNRLKKQNEIREFRCTQVLTKGIVLLQIKTTNASLTLCQSS